MNLEKYCHYQVRNQMPYNGISFMYVSGYNNLSEEKLRLKYKQLHREHMINSLESNEKGSLISEEDYISNHYVLPTIKTMMLSKKYYNNIDMMYKEVIQILDDIQSHCINNISSIINIAFHSNFNIIAGRKAFDVIKKINPNIDVELCECMMSNKFIICDLENFTTPGLILIHHPYQNAYFLGLTPEHGIESFTI